MGQWHLWSEAETPDYVGILTKQMSNRDNCKSFLTQSQNLLLDKTFAEFFAGIGLMRLGLEQEGWAVAFANDIARDKYEMYSAHFGEADSQFR